MAWRFFMASRRARARALRTRHLSPPPTLLYLCTHTHLYHLTCTHLFCAPRRYICYLLCYTLTPRTRLHAIRIRSLARRGARRASFYHAHLFCTSAAAHTAKTWRDASRCARCDGDRQNKNKNKRRAAIVIVMIISQSIKNGEKRAPRTLARRAFGTEDERAAA